MPRRPENLYPAYHAHLYFGPDTLALAREVAEAAGRELPVAVGRVHERPVGPHPQWSCQLAFDAAAFDIVIPWLEAHRGPMDAFVHGVTDNDLLDHTAHAMWLGNEWPLELRMFERRGD